MAWYFCQDNFRICERNPMLLRFGWNLSQHVCIYYFLGCKKRKFEFSYNFFSLPNIKKKELMNFFYYISFIFLTLVSETLFLPFKIENSYTGIISSAHYIREHSTKFYTGKLRSEVQPLALWTEKVSLLYSFYWQMVPLSHTYNITLHPFNCFD